MAQRVAGRVELFSNRVCLVTAVTSLSSSALNTLVSCPRSAAAPGDCLASLTSLLAGYVPLPIDFGNFMLLQIPITPLRPVPALSDSAWRSPFLLSSSSASASACCPTRLLKTMCLIFPFWSIPPNCCFTSRTYMSLLILWVPAVVDGASRWERIRYVVLPHLLPLTTFIALIQLMDNFRVFEEIWKGIVK